MPLWNSLFFSEENFADEQAHDTGKMERHAPDAEQQCDEGLGRRFQKHGAEAVGSEVVVKVKGEDIDDQGGQKGPQGQGVELLFQGDRSVSVWSFRVL